MLKKVGRHVCAGVLAGASLFNNVPARANTVTINELVVDPKRDYNGSGSITTSDEFFELYNQSLSSIDLSNWRLELIDTTPETETLVGTIAPGEYFLVENPRGAQNDNGRVELYSDLGELVDGVSYGNWDDGNVFDNAPSGNALNGFLDDSISRVPDGVGSFVKTRATPGMQNVPVSGTNIFVGAGVVGLGAMIKRRIGKRGSKKF